MRKKRFDSHGAPTIKETRAKRHSDDGGISGAKKKESYNGIMVAAAGCSSYG